MGNNYTSAPKQLYYCVKCDSQYGSCEHGHDYLPKDERGVQLSADEFQVLFDAGDID